LLIAKNRYFPKLINSLLVKLQKSEWRGKHKFYLFITKYYAYKLITHTIQERSFSVPVGEWCFWLEKGPENYYLDEFLPFCSCINTQEHDFTFFDLGADIGTVSSLVASHCQHLQNVIAFEPNPKAFEILQSNLSHMRQENTCINMAISNFEGTVSFCADTTRINDHEGHIDQSQQGDTPVTSLDRWAERETLKLASHLVVKIDVEGQEIQALQGATRVLQQAEKVVLLIEVHPEVLARTDNTPDDLFAAGEQVRPFEWVVPLCKGLVVDRDLPFFQQVPEGQYDIIGISTT
jgi:FkbM family methyltransferase